MLLVILGGNRIGKFTSYQHSKNVRNRKKKKIYDI